MKTKGKHRGRPVTPFILSSYVELEDVDIKKDLPFLQSVVDIDEIQLSILDRLQFDIEKLIGNVFHHSLHMIATIKRKPVQEHLCTFCLKDETEKSLSVKANPEKPLTLIFSQKRSSKLDKGKLPHGQPPYAISNSTPVSLTNGNVSPGKMSVAWTNGHRSSRQNSKKRKLELTVNGGDCDGSQGHEDPLQNPKVLYAVPNKFWALMEPFCAEITDEQTKTLEDLIKVYDDDASYYRIPPLGNDHHLRGCSELKQEPVENGHPVARQSHQKTNGHDSVAILRKISSEIRQPIADSSPIFSLTQSLVSSLVEENVSGLLSARLQDQLSDNDATSIDERATQPPKQLAKQLHVSNSYKLEKSIRAGLHATASLAHPISPGRVFALVEAEDDDEDEKDVDHRRPPGWEDLSLSGAATDPPEDEVLARLRQRQSELRLVSEANLATLRRLQHATRLDQQRQELTRRLAVADADVIEGFNKLESYRPNRKVPLKRDRENAWKCLKERKKILKELEAFDAKH